MSKVRLVFLGTADFAVPSLVAAHQDEHYEIVEVISQPDRPAGRKLNLKASPVKEKALQLGLNVFTPENLKQEIKHIKNLKADLAIVIAYGQILSQEFLDIFPLGAVNVHGSLLPRWRGAAPIQRALMAGDKESGVCLQKIVKKLDAGDVLAERKVTLDDNIDAEELYNVLKHKATELIHIELMDYIRGNLSGEKQDESLVTIAHKIDKSEGKIDWSQSQQDIWNQYRALKIWPGVWTYMSGKKIKLHAIKKIKEQSKVGEIQKNKDHSFSIFCADGAFKITQVQAESKPKMLTKDFLNGFDLPKQVDC